MNLDLLKALPIFHGLANEEIDVLADALVSNRYEDGAKIFEIGDKSEALYLIERGFIRLQMASNQTLATLGPGSLLGEETLFRSAPQEITAIAASELTLQELLDQRLREVFLKNPDIGIKLSRNYGGLLAQMDDYLVERLAKINEFSTLPRHTLQVVARYLQPRIVRAQTPIHRGGEMPSALFIVEHGTFELRPDPYVPGQETQQFGEGAIIGAMSLLTNKPYSETALSVEDSLLWVLPADKFQEVNSSNPGLRRSLGRNVRAKLSKADQAQAVLRLSQMPLFAEVPPQSLQAIAQRMILQHFPAGERVYRIGEAGDAIYFVENGEIELTEENSSGVVVEKARVGSGGFFGEMSLLTGVIRTEDSTATRNTNLWILYKADLDALSVQHPAISKALSQGLATRLAEPEPEQDDLEHFRSFGILADLSPADLRQVTRYLRPMRYRADETIYQADGPADALYFLERGQIYAQNIDGSSWVLGPGDTFGERAILSGEPHSSTVIADSDVDVWMLSKDDFDVVVTRYPTIALNITRMFSRRLNQYAMAPAPAQQRQASYAPVESSAAHTMPQTPMPIQRRAVGPAGMAPTNQGSGFVDWFVNLSTFGKVRLALFILLLLWLLGVAAPWMLLNLFSGTSVASGAVLSPGASAQALGAVASMGSFELASRDQELARALIVADSLAAPTPTHTPSATVTPNGATFVPAAKAEVAAVNASPTQTPVPLVQLVGAAPAAPPSAVIAGAAEQLAQAPPVEQEIVAAQAPAPSRAWDPRLNQLGVTLNEAAVGSGQQYWRLVDAHWADEVEAGGKHHIFVEVLDEGGNRIVGQPVTVTWAEGATTGATENKNPPDYAFNFQMYAAGYAYRVRVDGLPSDELVGAGLGSIAQRTYGIHTTYFLTYQKVTKP